MAEEVCSSMQTVRSFANEEGERKRYSDKLNDVYKIQFKQALSYSGYVWSTQVYCEFGLFSYTACPQSLLILSLNFVDNLYTA